MEAGWGTPSTIAKDMTFNGAVTLGDNGDVVTVNSSGWDVTTSEFTGVVAVSSDANSSAFGMDLPVTGTNATVHDFALQIDGTTALLIRATGNGAGGIGVFTMQIGTTSGADGITIGGGSTNLSINDADWNVTGPGAATFTSLALSGAVDMNTAQINEIGRLDGAGTAPTLSSCGTTPTITGNNTAGKVTVGTGTVTSCTVTFSTVGSEVFSVAPACHVTGDTAATNYVAATSATVLTITSDVTMDTDVVMYACIQP